MAFVLYDVSLGLLLLDQDSDVLKGYSHVLEGEEVRKTWVGQASGPAPQWLRG